jgi:hypothetical protein
LALGVRILAMCAVTSSALVQIYQMQRRAFDYLVYR